MFIILFFEIILNIKYIFNDIVILPFQEILENYSTLANSGILLNNYLDYKIYTEIKIGTPPKKLPVIVNSNLKIFRTKIDCEEISTFDFKKFERYIPKESSSFVNITDIYKMDEYYYFGYSLINESIKLFKDENCLQDIDIKNFQLFTERRDNILNNNYSYLCGEIGLSLSKMTNDQSNLLMKLKSLGIINSTVITIEYNDDKKGIIYIGKFPHEYNKNNYDEKFLKTAYAISTTGLNNKLRLRMDKIYIDDKNFNSYIYLENLGINLNYGLGFILSSEEYFNKILDIFFNKYINLNICKINIIKRGINNNYHIISCEKKIEFKINEFPSLYLFKEEFNYIFELDYKDLFVEIQNYYYFLIIYFPFSNEYIELGKPFLKKYQLSYNPDSTTVHFYIAQKKEVNENNLKLNNKMKIILLIGLIFMIFLLGVIFWKKIHHSKRKIRKNEINEDFDYNIPINDI